MAKAIKDPPPSPVSPRKKRKKQKKGGKQGKPFGSEKQELLGVVFDSLKEILSSSNSKLYRGSRKFKTTAELFESVTGVAASVGRSAKKKQKAKQEILPPKPKGPAPTTVDEKFEGFFDWVVSKVNGAKKGGYVTLDSLRRDLFLEHGIRVSKRLLRRSLRKLGFKYVRREGHWFSRRHEERIQHRLWDFLEWVVGSSEEKVVEGKREFYWKIPVGFQDETWVNERQFRKFSICAPTVKGGGKVDRSYDNGKSGEGTRVNILHCIFSHIPQPTNPDGTPECLVHWKSTWTGKAHPYSGKFTTSAHVEKFFRDKVFLQLSGGQGVACCDNASTHRAYTEEMEQMCDVQLLQLIRGKISSAKKGSFRAGYVKRAFKALVDKTPGGANGLTEGNLRSFICKHHLKDTKLWQVASDAYDVRLVYIPQYYPECNPIERYWSLLKRYYYDTDRTLPHKTRLSQALARIPDKYVDTCFRKSLEWCHAEHARMRARKLAAVPAMEPVEDEELAPTSDSSGESDDE